MPHLIKCNLGYFPVYRRFFGVQACFSNPAIYERAVAPKQFTHHIVGTFSQRIQQYTQRFQRCNFFVCPLISDNKVISALLARISLFSANLPAFDRSFRFAILAFLHNSTPLVLFAPLYHSYIYMSTLSEINKFPKINGLNYKSK